MERFDIEFMRFMDDVNESLENLANRLDMLEDRIADTENKVVTIDYDVKDLYAQSTK